jgi:hypothetical protein
VFNGTAALLRSGSNSFGKYEGDRRRNDTEELHNFNVVTSVT